MHAAPRRRFALRALLPGLALALALAACGKGGGGTAVPISQPAPTETKSACGNNFAAYTPTSFNYATTTELTGLPDKIVGAGNFGTITVTIPTSPSLVGVGIALQGSASHYVFIDDGLLLNTVACMTSPNGSVPLAFNQIDFNGDGILEDDATGLFNVEAPALFFPNDGSQRLLPGGTYTFPVGAADSNGNLVADTLTPHVYYKTAQVAQTTLTVNLWVAAQVDDAGKIIDPTTASADPIISGALQVLDNVYADAAHANLKLVPNVAVISNSFVDLTTQSQVDNMVSGASGGAAINLFIVGSIALPGIPGNVVGMALGLPGPFNLQNTVVSGVLVEYVNDGNGQTTGVTMAHELGHYLGLFHTSQTNGITSIIGQDPIADTLVCTNADLAKPGNITNCPDRNNLMFPYVAATFTPDLTAKQTTVVRLNPAVQ
jgi:hypothetical protein